MERCCDLEVGYLNWGVLHNLSICLRITVSEMQSAWWRLRADPGTMPASLPSSLHTQVDWRRLFGGLPALQKEVGGQELIHIDYFVYWLSIKKIKVGWASCWIMPRRSLRSFSFGSKGGVFFPIPPICRFPPFCFPRRFGSAIDMPSVPFFV